MEKTLAGRVALVIGGARGLGRAVVRAYAREGAILAVADLQRGEAQDALQEIGGTGTAEGLDVSDPAATRALIDSVAARYGKLDILVNCAAICLVDPLMDLTPERWDKVFAVNSKGAFFAMQAAARVMIPKSYGRIINISTPASRMGFPHFATYAASKAVVDSVTKAAAVAWAPHGITVNTIVPGRMTEGMVDALEKDLVRVTGKSEEELRAERTKGLPMGRRVAPSEVAEATVWLASEAAGYVTAERFNFTGGMELS